MGYRSTSVKDLRAGDIVGLADMRIVVLEDARQIAHPGHITEPVYGAPGRVLNIDKARRIHGGLVPSDGSWAFQGIEQVPYLVEFTDCSYCDAAATHVGAGTDGDFYCDEHVELAPGDVDPINDEQEA